MQLQIEIPQGQVEAFCRRWKVSELALFGSVLRDDADPLCAIAERTCWTCFSKRAWWFPNSSPISNL